MDHSRIFRHKTYRAEVGRDKKAYLVSKNGNIGRQAWICLIEGFAVRFFTFSSDGANIQCLDDNEILLRQKTLMLMLTLKIQ
jgi:hypothetical protein